MCFSYQIIKLIKRAHRHYIVFELAVGGELFDRILSKGRFTEADAVEALRYAMVRSF